MGVLSRQCFSRKRFDCGDIGECETQFLRGAPAFGVWFFGGGVGREPFEFSAGIASQIDLAPFFRIHCRNSITRL